MDVDPVTGVVPKVADFGLSRIVRVNPEEMTVTVNWNNGGHWSPPEYLDYDEDRLYVGPDHPTKAGDTWMFSMTFLVSNSRPSLQINHTRQLILCTGTVW